ncbi:hypothetical protein SAMN06297387_101468 [Streptomyces zhaozhouensis]|uniref:Asp23 family, cell envelope-related function n=1 Tax=Streptomyces zhaozhouensis TaxID=1300267 RepID=A0A286DKE7_9ACTN|nr:hypothetical protein [Streptomyces zhaozhouensis]SOD59073.1 hypothetical protein SAMN06297387_101468 [Streptomyces zhaozhouensis]
MSGSDGRDRVREAVGVAVRGVEGVAFPASGIAGLLRGRAGGRGAGGVRVDPLPGGGWRVEVSVGVVRGHRAVDVTRAVRRAVRGAVAETAPGTPAGPLGVTVTVTSIT